MPNRLPGALAALALAWPFGASADPLTLDTLLGLETFGRIAVDPTGAVGVFEERRARGDLPRYDLQPEGMLRYARLYRIDLDAPDRIAPLLPMAQDAGYTLGPFSPDGARVVVYRLQDLTFRMGIVTLATGEVVWTDLSPDTGAWGRTVEWLSGDRLLALTVPDGGLPPRLASQIVTQTRLPALWARAARGEAAFVSVGPDTNGARPDRRDLRRIDARTGRSERITDGPFLDFEVSPGGRFVAVLQDGPGRTLPAPDTAAQGRRAHGLRLVDLVSGVSVDPPEARDISPTLLSWSPGSDALLVAPLDGPNPRLLAIDGAGQTQDRTPDGVTPVASIDAQVLPVVQAAWLGQTPVVRGLSNGRSGWHVQRAGRVERLEGIADDARVVARTADGLIFASGGRAIRVAFDLAIEDLGVAASTARPDGPLGHRSATDPMKAAAATVMTDAGRLCRVSNRASPAACVAGSSGAAVSWSRGVSLGVGASGLAANRLTLSGETGARTIHRLNPDLDAVEIAPPRRVMGAGGASGWLYLPAAPLDRPPPVIVIPYPGRVYPVPPRNMAPESAHLTQNGQLLIAAGYAVLYPDLPATEEPSDRLAARILAVVDAAAADGRVDARRIGLWGHSFGAWASVLAATQSDRFGAVVALNGAYNLPTALAFLSPHDRLLGAHEDALQGAARWLETGQAGMRRAYGHDPGRYRRGSAFEGATRLSAPVLLVHGEFDFSGNQAELMYATLRRLGRSVALTWLVGEDHSIHNPGNARAYYDQLIGWFDRHLRPSTNAQPAAAIADPARLHRPD